jgi:hypothetical protein
VRCARRSAVEGRGRAGRLLARRARADGRTHRPRAVTAGTASPASESAFAGFWRMSYAPRDRGCSDAISSAVSSRAGVPTICFEAALRTIGNTTIARLPESASGRLPSRGQVAVEGTINGHGFQTVLEPDGDFGHWMRIDSAMRRGAALRVGDIATFEIELLRDWPEPNVPEDLEASLAAAPETIRDLWSQITPMARWEWVRWINATRNTETRKRRVEVTISKLSGGKRRPCCFNLASCTDPNLSRNGRLAEPA